MVTGMPDGVNFLLMMFVLLRLCEMQLVRIKQTNKQVRAETQTRRCDNLLLCSADGPVRSVVTVGLASSLDHRKFARVVCSRASMMVHNV